MTRFLCLIFILLSCSHTETKSRQFSNDNTERTIDLFEETTSSKRSYKVNFEKLSTTLDSLEIKYKGLLTATIIDYYEGDPIYRIDLAGNNTSKNTKKIIITAGLHGDESIGIGAMIDFIHLIVKDPHYRDHFDFTFFPYLNPVGLKKNSRYLKNKIDLNRSFAKGKEQVPTRIFKKSVQNENFELALDLHEAPTKRGFFAIKADQNDSNLARNAIKKMPTKVIFSSPDGKYPYKVPNSKNPKKFSYTLLAPGETVSFNPGTMKGYFKTQLQSKYAYTLEAPGKMELNKKLNLYVEFVKYFVNSYRILSSSPFKIDND